MVFICKHKYLKTSSLIKNIYILFDDKFNDTLFMKFSCNAVMLKCLCKRVMQVLVTIKAQAAASLCPGLIPFKTRISLSALNLSKTRISLIKFFIHQLTF